ncbi:MAG: hypothetical protein KatS3mg024_0185 [Armatimonadota bacterium]|nr:MAG: hypothetical protein KatS3mg024_0185 [Armatimonadota bacterium]
MQASAASFAALPFAGAARAERVNTQTEVGAVPERVFQKPSGEPYSLLGSRMVFTNWLFIRPGSFAWVDEQGNHVSVGGSAGMWGPRLTKAEFPYGIRLVARPARRMGPVMTLPEGQPFSYLVLGSVIQDGGVYRAWTGPHYRESTDGVNWGSPVPCQADGGGPMSLAGGTVFVDPSAPRHERYKYVGGGQISREDYERFKSRYPDRWEPRSDRENHILAVVGAVSGDGVHWKILPEPLVVEHSDTHITAYYDQRLRKYVIYTRNYMIWPSADPKAAGTVPWYEIGRRSIGRTESDRFEAFPVSEVVLVPDPSLQASELLYTNCRTCIPGAPDLHLMFPAIWHLIDDTTSTVVASSHDGKVWTYLPGGPVLETPEYGEWDGGCHFAGPNLIELPNGDFALPYCGYNFPHKYPRGQLKNGVGYAIWPKGRIIALEAAERGEFTTGAFMPPGRKMRINAVTARAGHIRIEVLDLAKGVAAGRSFADCDPIVGDRFRHPVTWKGQEDLGHSQGAPVRLRFQMEKAAIYALDFE